MGLHPSEQHTGQPAMNGYVRGCDAEERPAMQGAATLPDLKQLSMGEQGALLVQ